MLTCVCCLFLVLTRAHSTYVQVCTQLRNLRFFVCLRKIAKIARSTIFQVHLRFFAVVSRVNDISRKRVANFAKIAKNRKANDFSRSLAIFRSSVIRNDYPARNRSISRSSFYGLATALRCFTMTCRGPLCSLHRLDDFPIFFRFYNNRNSRSFCKNRRPCRGPLQQVYIDSTIFSNFSQILQ